MATCLSAFTRIEKIVLRFRSPRYDRATQSQSQPRHIPFVLPTLRLFYFTGDSDYLERIIAPINAPALVSIHIKFFNQLVFKTPSLRQFIGRTEASKTFRQVNVSFSKGFAGLALLGGDNCPISELGISSRMLDWQLLSVAQLCSSFLPPLPPLESLKDFPRSTTFARQHRRHPMARTSTPVHTVYFREGSLLIRTIGSTCCMHRAKDVWRKTDRGVIYATRYFPAGGTTSARRTYPGAISQLVTTRQLSGFP